MSEVFMTPEQLLTHWQGHQRLTRRVIEAFPEDDLFSYTPAPPMRPFGALVLEIIGMVAPTLNGLTTGTWEMPDWGKVAKTEGVSKAELLAQWDKTADILAQHLPDVDRFDDVDTAFGQWTMRRNDLIMYLIDNEIHHRAQGYVYLRALGIEPPAFPER